MPGKTTTCFRTSETSVAVIGQITLLSGSNNDDDNAMVMMMMIVIMVIVIMGDSDE